MSPASSHCPLRAASFVWPLVSVNETIQVAAYVGALERLRNQPISASEYAQILAASEHRQVPAVLRDLEMPAAAHLPIVRLWTAKLARDPKLSFEMIQAVAALREGAASPTSATS